MAADQAKDAAGSPPEKESRSDEMIDTGSAPRSAQKVELDLDDAPFLEEEEEAPPPEPVKQAETKVLEPEAEAKPAGPGRKKLILMAAAGVALLLVLGVAAKFLFFKSKPAAEPKPPVEQAANQTAAEDNATQAKLPDLPGIQVRLEPFWVEQKGQGEEVRFLIVRILLATSDPLVAKELETKLLPARNAVFYYLKNKDVQFLADEHNAEKLKNELLLVINQYITDGKFETLLFEEYVVK